MPAVAQMTKQGLLFMFHRLTGEPLFGVEERPVPRFDAPGDQAWPTQPFPVKPAGLTRDGMTRKEVSKISPEAREVLHGAVRQVRQHGPVHAVRDGAEPGVPGIGRWRRLGRRRGQSGARTRVREHAASRRHRTAAVQHVLGRPAVVRQAESSDQLLRRSAGVSVQRTAMGRVHRGEHDYRRHGLAHAAGEYAELTAKGILDTGTAVNDGGPIPPRAGSCSSARPADEHESARGGDRAAVVDGRACSEYLSP